MHVAGCVDDPFARSRVDQLKRVFIMPVEVGRCKGVYGFLKLCAPYNAVIYKKQFMKLSSVRSFTAIVTPLSQATGLNFLIVNSLGSRMVFLFLSRSDVKEISSYLDKALRKEETADETA